MNNKLKGISTSKILVKQKLVVSTFSFEVETNTVYKYNVSNISSKYLFSEKDMGSYNFKKRPSEIDFVFSITIVICI